jgi:hypothetical protein
MAEQLHAGSDAGHRMSGNRSLTSQITIREDEPFGSVPSGYAIAGFIQAEGMDIELKPSIVRQDEGCGNISTVSIANPEVLLPNPVQVKGSKASIPQPPTSQPGMPFT